MFLFCIFFSSKIQLLFTSQFHQFHVICSATTKLITGLLKTQNRIATCQFLKEQSVLLKLINRFCRSSFFSLRSCFLCYSYYVEYFRLFKCIILYLYQMVILYNVDIQYNSSRTSKLYLSSHFPPVISSSS